jgi:hypothetical protein
MRTDAWKHVRIKDGDRTTQFVPLQHYQRRDRWFLFYLVCVHFVAAYGLFDLIRRMLERRTTNKEADPLLRFRRRDSLV